MVHSIGHGIGIKVGHDSSMVEGFSAGNRQVCEKFHRQCLSKARSGR
jgi:hypothetical protein